MPRWASRITLEITSIRVERVQDISEADAIAEGCSDWVPCGCKTGTMNRINTDGDLRHTTFKEGYGVLWDSINAKRGYGWDVNPWAWVIGFFEVKI